MEEEMSMLEELIQSDIMADQMHKKNTELYIYQSHIYELFKTNEMRKYFLAMVYNKKELLNIDIQIQQLPQIYVKNWYTMEKWERRRLEDEEHARKQEENRRLGKQEQKFVRLTIESFQVNLLYENVVYQIRYMDDDTDAMGLMALYFDYSDLSEKLWDEQRRNLHLWIFTKASLSYVPTHPQMPLYGYYQDKETPYIVNHKKIQRIHVHHDKNTLRVFSYPDFMNSMGLKVIDPSFKMNKFEDFHFKVYLITFINNQIYFFRQKFIKKKLNLEKLLDHYKDKPEHQKLRQQIQEKMNISLAQFTIKYQQWRDYFQSFIKRIEFQNVDLFTQFSPQQEKIIREMETEEEVLFFAKNIADSMYDSKWKK